MTGRRSNRERLVRPIRVYHVAEIAGQDVSVTADRMNELTGTDRFSSALAAVEPLFAQAYVRTQRDPVAALPSPEDVVHEGELVD